MEQHHSHNAAEWRSTTAQNANKKTAERKASFTTSPGSAIEIPDLCTPENLADFEPGTKLGYPGEFPFTRGVHPGMYRSRLWTMRQYAGFGTAEESNQRYHFLLSQGTTGLSVAFDLPTQMGYDADHPLAAGEGGEGGAPLSFFVAMELLVDQ